MQPNARGFAEQNDPATFHPSLMDEEDLPPYLPERIGIVYVELASVLSDEINIMAWLVDRERIRYEMFDDNDGGYAFSPQESAKPLSLEELTLMIDGVDDGEG